MEPRIFTDQDREAYAGLLPFAPGASAPFTPAAFQSVAGGRHPAPVFQTRPYAEPDRKNMEKAGWTKESIAEAMDNGAVPTWRDLRSLPDGSEIVPQKGVLVTLPDLVFYQLHKKCSDLTVGPTPTKEEKEALT